MKNPIIALLGNPNVGKTSLFNRITKLNQKVGNYPGITVEKREGSVKVDNQTYRIIDLPGTYTLYPDSLDEEVVFNTLADKNSPLKPDLVVVISEPANLKRSIILYEQVRELGLPAIFVVNMIDETIRKGIFIDIPKLEGLLQTKVYQTNARSGAGVDSLIRDFDKHPPLYISHFEVDPAYTKAINEAKLLFPLGTEYATWQFLAKGNSSFLDKETNKKLAEIRFKNQLNTQLLQKDESIQRNNALEKSLENIVKKNIDEIKEKTNSIDAILMHPVFGYVIFFGLLFLIFQAIYAWSGPAMDAIDGFFGNIAAWVQTALPAGPLADLLSNGIIKGIGGIVIFVPQIVILYFFISIMEETGYMSRVVFLMDRWLRPFGLNGKSVIPLMSGAACAVPAVMSARNIENAKERLITMLVTPFMTCSARLPIYIVIISLVIPDTSFLGFHVQGMVLFALYIMGTAMALFSSWILNKIIKSSHQSFLIFELPSYKNPHWKNVFNNVLEKTSSFVLGAGKIILAISVILWALGSFGPGKDFSHAEEIVRQQNPELPEVDMEHEIASYRVEHSYLGYIGQAIEPAVKPLGYDWKMGIGLISSFAAREVFVGTMATVYSLGDEIDIEDDGQKQKILSKMKSEINGNTGLPAYNFASGISLLLFYAFAMQCMSTVATVKRETGSWKWTMIQLGFMTGLAYISALIAYQVLK